MDQTTRALVVVAASALLLAPVVNGVLQEAVATADRVVLEDADWEPDPPEDPPDDPPEDPPDQEPPEELEGNATAGAQPSCEIEEEIVALWNHEDPQEDPVAGSSNRTQTPSPQDFEVTNRTLALGIGIEITNMTGRVSASVGSQSSDDPAYSNQWQHTSESDGSDEATISREQLEEGTWEASLTHEGSVHDELTFVVLEFSCREDTS